MEQHTAKPPPTSTFFKQTRNYQVSQQAVLLALINRHFSLSLSAPKKKSVVAQQMITVNYLRRGSDTVAVDEFIHRRLAEIQQYDISQGVAPKTAARRCENNRIAEVNHLLIDILREFGYSFSTKVTDGKNGTIKTESVYSILYKGTTLFTRSTIQSSGLAINKYLNDLLFETQTTLVSKNNCILHHMLPE
ncbi:hypothetical protein EDI_193900 [Entamoeba dispar SAW760]|uniref:Uncharacterized protein n=1 Tax=Entamoeba dispar (strain ATCC PRA-260 / SAW760) TaxID=370354 RepID=B0EAC4_ENTDS|nr:uncharacterized protein EDI_193900 [Entamoeba dispar SAW760]EDR28509.1 hypothetical protein EDI_193900 [Entamoeba dispar SAW760]|eukprot:EDR28509.1 hypothetical protein EDI_193900 [Entamoeba dispar SAW760]